MEAIVAVAPVNTMLVAALLGLMKLALGVSVTKYRLQNKIMWGDASDGGMARRIRAHANFTEWVPGTLILLGLIEMMGVSPIIIAVLGAMLIIARCLHALGLMGNAESFNRATGIVINWATLGLSIRYRDRRIFCTRYPVTRVQGARRREQDHVRLRF
ncbi:MAG: MAPEG family protein [Alphaproteobacteria bacterium]